MAVRPPRKSISPSVVLSPFAAASFAHCSHASAISSSTALSFGAARPARRRQSPAYWRYFSILSSMLSMIGPTRFVSDTEKAKWRMGAGPDQKPSSPWNQHRLLSFSPSWDRSMADTGPSKRRYHYASECFGSPSRRKPRRRKTSYCKWPRLGGTLLTRLNGLRLCGNHPLAGTPTEEFDSQLSTVHLTDPSGTALSRYPLTLRRITNKSLIRGSIPSWGIIVDATVPPVQAYDDGKAQRCAALITLPHIAAM